MILGWIDAEHSTVTVYLKDFSVFTLIYLLNLKTFIECYYVSRTGLDENSLVNKTDPDLL